MIYFVSAPLPASAGGCPTLFQSRSTRGIFADTYYRRGNYELAEKFYKLAGELENAKKAKLAALATEYEQSEKVQFAIWIWRHLGNFERAETIQSHLQRMLVHSPLEYIDDLPDGNNGRKRLYQIVGTPFKAVVKGTESYRENPMMEVFAYRFDNLLKLDLVPTTVRRTVDNETGSVQIFTPGLRGDDYIMQKYAINRSDFITRTHLDSVGHDEFTELRNMLESLGNRTHFLGFVLGTYDRHPLNLVIDWELEGIVPEDLYLGTCIV